ncbi:hypothetical protein [Sphingosinicella rhizophila]|uniref:HEPN domain-containing protein n=1 Tax=Sphingosinicella rhizophila TaxID=3050082 RepID=A0ABU3QAJ1_9SPHN|nr:hypothetical protein [Sphingosinicella sp. GR2756]MDT9600013.1 hypothetical protein [Sphingosinicella sp. GR2756]
MFIKKAYASRDSLSDAELERLLAALKDEAERYRYAIRNYPPDRLERHGKPFLAGLEERVDEVQHLLSERANRSD